MSGRSFVLNNVNGHCVDSSYEELLKTVIRNFNTNTIAPINELARTVNKVEEWCQELKIPDGKLGYIEGIHKLPFIKFEASGSDKVLSVLDLNEKAVIAIKKAMDLSAYIVGTNRKTWKQALGLLFDLWFKLNARKDRMTSTVSLSASTISFTVVDFARPKPVFKAELDKLDKDIKSAYSASLLGHENDETDSPFSRSVGRPHQLLHERNRGRPEGFVRELRQVRLRTRVR
jgi:hypothetical protein